MTHSLTTAILDHTIGWELLLSQIGVPYRAVHNLGELSPDKYAVVIVNRHLWEEEREIVDGYVRAGGAVLDIGFFWPSIQPKAFRRRRVQSVVIQHANELLQGIPVLDLESRVSEYRSGDLLNGLVHIEAFGAGAVGFAGFDPGKLVLDHRARTRQFPSMDGAFPAERVSRISKGALSTLLRSLLVRLYAERGLPFVCKRSFPRDAPNVLCFRIDSDYGSRDQIDRLYELAHGTHTKMTWFLHLEAHIGWLGRFKEFEQQEIALHCMRHRTFPEFEENRANIAKGLSVLKEQGFDVEGFSAPNGIWNHGLAKAIDQHGFLYSSEFGLAYDMLPFFPPLPRRQQVNQRFYRAMQIPVHPVSVGNLARVGVADGRMVAYYQDVIQRNVALNEPLIFYHHPTHERWEVVRGMLEAAHTYKPLSLTFREYARWWNIRQGVQFDAELKDDSLLITSHGADDSVWFDVMPPDGRRSYSLNDGSAYPIPDSDIRDVPEFEDSTGLRRFSFTLKRRALRDWIIRTGR